MVYKQGWTFEALMPYIPVQNPPNPHKPESFNDVGKHKTDEI